MARIIDILGELSRSLGVPVLTPEYEIALTLLDRPNLTADQLLEQSSFSRAGFFNTMDRLKGHRLGRIDSQSDRSPVEDVPIERPYP